MLDCSFAPVGSLARIHGLRVIPHRTGIGSTTPFQQDMSVCRLAYLRESHPKVGRGQGPDGGIDRG